MWLNINRARAQQASNVASGVRAGTGDEDLPLEWYDGICGLEEQVEDAMLDENLHRSMRRLLTQARRH